MAKKNEQIAYQSNSKGYIVDIKINFNNFKSNPTFPDLKQAEKRRKSSFASKSSSNTRLSNNANLMSYLNSYADADKSILENAYNRDYFDSSELMIGYNNKTNIANGNAKFKSTPVDNNEAFKYLKTRLANKHYEAVSRPSFNVAGISPIIQNEQTTNEIYDRKLTKSTSRLTKVNQNDTTSARVHFNQIKNENKKLQPEHSTPQQNYILYQQQNIAENISPLSIYNEVAYKKILKVKNEPSSPVNSLVSNSNIAVGYVRETISRKELNRINNNENDASLKNENSPNEPVNNETKSSYINNDSNQKSLQEQLNSIYLTLPSIFPKLNRPYDTEYNGQSQLNFDVNYKQSGTSPKVLNMCQKGSSYGKELKINVGAPKSWLKSKYMPNSRVDNVILPYTNLKLSNRVTS